MGPKPIHRCFEKAAEPFEKAPKLLDMNSMTKKLNTGLKEYEVTTRLMALMKILRNSLRKIKELCLQLMDFYL